METAFRELNEKINALTKKMEQVEIARKDRKIRTRDQLNDIYDAFEEQSNNMDARI